MRWALRICAVWFTVSIMIKQLQEFHTVPLKTKPWLQYNVYLSTVEDEKFVGSQLTLNAQLME